MIIFRTGRHLVGAADETRKRYEVAAPNVQGDDQGEPGHVAVHEEKKRDAPEPSTSFTW